MSRPLGIIRFPHGFLWGAGISAHQAEGGNRHNDWWAFEQGGGIANGEVSGGACDHYNRYPEDFALAAELGHGAHKLSVEWSRIEKTPGVYDEDELEHYVDVVRTLRELGIRPFVTLHHFTNPMWFSESGGWLRPDAPAAFARFAREVVKRLGPYVDDWITLNEPMLVAHFGYVNGYWPPGRRSMREGLKVARTLTRAHCAAYEVIRAESPAASIGAAVNTTIVAMSLEPSLTELALMRPLDWLANSYFLDRVRGNLDFVGLQYYSRVTARQLLFAEIGAKPLDRRPEQSDIGWEIYPEGLRDVVRHAWRRYGLPIYVTENGLADRNDRLREGFIRDHLAWLHRAISEGADVRGYFHWALLDNFEWREGFGPRFGLIEVDYDTQERTVRDSARYYERICRTNELEVAE